MGENFLYACSLRVVSGWGQLVQRRAWVSVFNRCVCLCTSYYFYYTPVTEGKGEKGGGVKIGEQFG